MMNGINAAQSSFNDVELIAITRRRKSRIQLQKHNGGLIAEVINAALWDQASFIP